MTPDEWGHRPKNNSPSEAGCGCTMIALILVMSFLIWL